MKLSWNFQRGGGGEAKKKSFDLGGNRTHDLRIRSTVTLPTGLRGRTDKDGDDLGGESRRRESKGTYECCVYSTRNTNGATEN